MKKITRVFISLLSVLFILVLWIILSAVTNAELIFPYPHSVLQKIAEIICNPVFWKHFFKTFIRIIYAVFISVITGTLIGVLCGSYPWINQFFKLPVSIIRSTPVIAVILMALFWFKSTQVPVFVAVLMAFPVMVSSVQKGFEQNGHPDLKPLLNMAKVYNFSSMQTFWKIRCPYAVPYFISGVQSVFGLTWKVVCAGEVLSLPKYSMGNLMHSAQLHLESAELIGLTVIVVLSSFIFEQILIFCLKAVFRKSKTGYFTEK